MLYAFARPLLFALDPETAHDLTLAALRTVPPAAVRCTTQVPSAEPIEAMGLRFPNRVGLAAGLDKNGACIDGLAALGFGFIEVGTVTPRPQPGNPRPRMFRLPEREALINRMGFNNDGVEKLVANVRAARFGPASGGILGINIGKNFDTPIERAAEDYVYCLERVYAYASYVTVNISSPNTANLRSLQEREGLRGLLGAINAARARLGDRHGRRVPLAVKIAPDLETGQLGAIADELRRQQVDAVIATNTTTSREGVEGLADAGQAGGLSGAPLFARATSIIAELARRLAGELPIIGVGGIMSGAQAKAKLDAGATLVQLYTGLVYRGPGLVRDAIAATRG